MSDKTQIQNRTNIIIILLLSLVLALSFIVVFFITKDRGSWDISNTFSSQAEYTMSLDEFLVNLKTEGNTRNYLKIKVSLMYEDRKSQEILAENQDRIRDILVAQFRSKTANEILNTDNIQAIKDEIIQKINEPLNNEVVKDIYFTDLVVQ